jgi:hypothetical protein
MSDSTVRIYNAITVTFLALTVGMVLFTVVMLIQPNEDTSADDLQLAALPTAFESATPTSTFTLTPTLTVTPSPSPTDTLTPTNTEPPTLSPTPSPTISDTPGPTETPSNTPTPSVSPTNTPTDTPVGPTATLTPTSSPFLFELRGELLFQANTSNTLGCAWQGIGGSVLGLDGQPATQQYQVRVFNDSFESTSLTGQNSYYDPTSGWEVRVADTINASTYRVRLETLIGTPISDEVQVTFPQDCNANVAVIRFIQVQQLGGGA